MLRALVVLLLVLGTSCARAGCGVDNRLVPSCGVLWGIAPGVFTGAEPATALRRAESSMGRTADIMHVYHRDGELFPTPQEIAMADERLLLINWKPATDRTWAEIADGDARVDRRIDRLAAHIKAVFSRRFFLTVHHEPENDVGGPGFAAGDYRRMFRHVVVRLRAAGVDNAVTVMTYMGAPNWGAQPWFEELYPGGDVVDWIGVDPYADHRVEDFAGLLNKTRPEYPGWPGFYRWTQRRFPGKPLMVAEWGVFARPGRPSFTAEFFASARRQLDEFPQVKALVYFESPRAPRGDTRFDVTEAARAQFRHLAAEVAR